MRVSLQNVINDVNRMSDGGSMMLGGTKIKLEFFLGGDYKVYIGNYFTHVTILFDPKAPLALCILEQVFFSMVFNPLSVLHVDCICHK